MDDWALKKSIINLSTYVRIHAHRLYSPDRYPTLASNNYMLMHWDIRGTHLYSHVILKCHMRYSTEPFYMHCHDWSNHQKVSCPPSLLQSSCHWDISLQCDQASVLLRPFTLTWVNVLLRPFTLTWVSVLLRPFTLTWVSVLLGPFTLT